MPDTYLSDVIEAAQAREKTLRDALERANRIVCWMAPHIGRMCPPPDGISELNEHWILMQQMGIPTKFGPDGRPIDQKPEEYTRP